MWWLVIVPLPSPELLLVRSRPHRSSGWSSWSATCPSGVALPGEAHPERNDGGGEGDVVGDVEAHGCEPCPSDGGVEAAAEVGDALGLGDRDGGDRVGAGQG